VQSTRRVDSRQVPMLGGSTLAGRFRYAVRYESRCCKGAHKRKRRSLTGGIGLADARSHLAKANAENMKVRSKNERGENGAMLARKVRAGRNRQRTSTRKHWDRHTAPLHPGRGWRHHAGRSRSRQDRWSVCGLAVGDWRLPADDAVSAHAVRRRRGSEGRNPAGRFGAEANFSRGHWTALGREGPLGITETHPAERPSETGGPPS